MRVILFDEDDALAVARRLQHDGYDARLDRERLAGEDDDEDHPWAVVTDAPAFVVELVVDEYDGWLDDDLAERPQVTPPLNLPAAPKRHHRAPGDRPPL